MTAAELFEILQAQFPALKQIPMPVIPENLPAHEGKPYRDADLYIECPAADWPNLPAFLKETPQLDFNFLTMVTAVDYLKPADPAEKPRIDVVYHLFSLQHRHRLVVKIPVAREGGEVASAINVWVTADWQEREVFDMFGVKFSGHPNCTRILMWEGFPGWPLKKDFVHTPDRYDD